MTMSLAPCPVYGSQRMTLEDVEEAWQQHVGAANVVVEKKGEESDDDTTMTVQSFVRAFSDLARAKYLHGGAGTVNRLLLRDVLGNNSAIGKIVSSIFWHRATHRQAQYVVALNSTE